MDSSVHGYKDKRIRYRQGSLLAIFFVLNNYLSRTAAERGTEAERECVGSGGKLLFLMFVIFEQTFIYFFISLFLLSYFSLICSRSVTVPSNTESIRRRGDPKMSPPTLDSSAATKRSKDASAPSLFIGESNRLEQLFGWEQCGAAVEGKWSLCE